MHTYSLEGTITESVHFYLYQYDISDKIHEDNLPHFFLICTNKNKPQSINSHINVTSQETSYTLTLHLLTLIKFTRTYLKNHCTDFDVTNIILWSNFSQTQQFLYHHATFDRSGVVIGNVK